jgi:hypothetical protein
MLVLTRDSFDRWFGKLTTGFRTGSQTPALAYHSPRFARKPWVWESTLSDEAQG